MTSFEDVSRSFQITPNAVSWVVVGIDGFYFVQLFTRYACPQTHHPISADPIEFKRGFFKTNSLTSSLKLRGIHCEIGDVSLMKTYLHEQLGPR